MSCFVLSAGSLVESSTITDFSTCSTTVPLGSYFWMDTAADQAAGSFDIATAQQLVGMTLLAFAVAYTFRMIRDMILNRR